MHTLILFFPFLSVLLTASTAFSIVRKGFSFSAVKNALKKYSEELEYSEEDYV